MAVSFGSLPIDGPAAEKLNQLREHIRRSSSADGKHLSIAEALFSRAPIDFIEGTDVAAMNEIAAQVLEFYNGFPDSGETIKVQALQWTRSGAAAPVSALMTTICDRPFIIDTISEALSQRKLGYSTFLHPILEETSGKAYSLSYIELEHEHTPEQLADLQDDVRRRLADLILVTDDFSSMLVLAETVARLIEGGAGANSFSDYERKEHSQLIKWLADGSFLFLGHREWEADAGKGSKAQRVPASDLGLFRTANPALAAQLEDTQRDVEHLMRENALVYFSRILATSPVHRTVPIEVVTVKTPRIDGGKTRVFCFLGLLTSKAIVQEASSVPIIRRKLHNILELEGFSPNTHDYKEVISIAGAIPKADLLQFPLERLRKEIHLVFNLRRKNEVRTSYFLDPLKRFILVNVVLPRERFSDAVRRKVQQYIEREFNVKADSAIFQLSVTEHSLVVMRLLVPNPGLHEPKVNFSEIEHAIGVLTLTWADSLGRLLDKQFGKPQGEKLRDFYQAAFPEQYKAATSPAQAAEDIQILQALNEQASLEVAVRQAPETKSTDVVQLKIYRLGERMTLSDTIPYLQNLGFEVLSETVTSIEREGQPWAGLYDLRIKTAQKRGVLEGAERVLIPGIKLILDGRADNDKLNALLVEPGLTSREIAALRTATNYLWQIKAIASRSTAVEALIENPYLARLLIDYFEEKFDPQRYAGTTVCSTRRDALTELEERIAAELKTVHRLVHDRAIRSLLNVIQSTVRTNFYRVTGGFRIAFKIDCAAIAALPKPKPVFEIFVNAPDFEGVHLRGGKVARGGLRWSERKEDYRTEVLGLMKTQMVKNSIIVPVGAKGGFLLKTPPSEGKQLADQVRHAYTQFVRSLLEVTDNRQDDEIVPPPATVIYDPPDPYLVVAADRGTATFSDLANSLAMQEFSFWLDDAFASGGSNGYDHKKLAITARGAWETVHRHFREIGIDIENQDFTVVGIGDMSGDVFGNGMILSRRIKLVGAFNHKHIFLDPAPDSARSYEERKRMFELPGSAWTDYDCSTISSGGGIYERSAKEIELSREAAHALGCAPGIVSGEELIRAILKAPVDLLWNGGIGTYVKALEEDNIHVGDRTNDEVRVNARELRVKVVGEGGNLGFTQLARIEYSKIGGHCNTDAVDNSGGVAMSDLEVNLKILLTQPLHSGELTLEERNRLLVSLSDDCCERVVSRNRTQSRAISVAVRRSRKNLGYYRGLINSLEAEGLLNRHTESLPDDDTLEKRIAMKAGLTRPELAVLIACSKMSLFRTIIDSDLPEKPFLQSYLTGYFPQSVCERFPRHVASHPLRREIIATQIANIAVECMGASFIYRTAEESGAERRDILSAFLAAYAIAGADELISQLRAMDKVSSTRAYLVSLVQISAALDGMTRWVLDARDRSIGLAEFVSKYRDAFGTLLENTDSLLNDSERNRFNESTRLLLAHDVPKLLAHRITAIGHAGSYLDIIEIAQRISRPPLGVAKLYSNLGMLLQVQSLLEQVAELEPADRWEALASRTIGGDLRRTLGRLTRMVVEETGSTEPEAIQAYLAGREEALKRYRSSIGEFSAKPITIPALMVIANQLAALGRSLT